MVVQTVCLHEHFSAFEKYYTLQLLDRGFYKYHFGLAGC